MWPLVWSRQTREAIFKTPRWNLQDAEAKFDELIAGALDGQPQTITQHGHDVAVVISAAEYERLAERPNGSLIDFLSSTGIAELDLPDRTTDDGHRDIEF